MRHDGRALVEIGAEVSEQMDVVPKQVRVLQHHRIKYACPCCDLGLKVTPAPALTFTLIAALPYVLARLAHGARIEFGHAQP